MLDKSRLIVAAAALAICGCQQPSPGVGAEGVGDDAATANVMQLSLASLDGGNLDPTDLAELVLIDFWATWCGPCHLQADILAKLYPELKEKGVEFLAISLGEPEAVVREFVEKRPFAYPVLIDPDDFVLENYGIIVLPTVVVLDRDGRILYKHEGISTADRLRSAIEEILEGSRPTARL